jgi:hypothetical protein
MENFLILLGLLFMLLISIHIPHNSKNYNLSWHSRILSTATLIYILYLIGLGIYTIFNFIFN